MEQVHKRFSDTDVKALLSAYCNGAASRAVIQEALGLGKTRFFALLKRYRSDPDSFAVAYSRSSRSRLPKETEARIEHELHRDQQLLQDRRFELSGYNYSHLHERLRKDGVEVSLNTLIRRAKALGCYIPHAKHKAHPRQVVTEAIGALIQHDASTHMWSPDASEKWTLITSIDDFSRMILFADFFPHETTWAHIQATKSLVQTYGAPLCYYVDCLRVFRFVQGRDSFWRNHVLETDDADPQWKQMMQALNVRVSYALSPQAKGKVERPFRWLQDRIVRTCALEKLSSLLDVRQVLQEEVHRYNHRQVHSTTKEIPSVRFEKALSQGLSLFRPFSLPAPYTSPDDVFCLRQTRTVSTYQRISLSKHEIALPGTPPHEQVEVHLIPDLDKQAMAVRVWWNLKLLHATTLPLNTFRVHF
jgi:hypothetical protein